jgi:hypothetical protein
MLQNKEAGDDDHVFKLWNWSSFSAVVVTGTAYMPLLSNSLCRRANVSSYGYSYSYPGFEILSISLSLLQSKYLQGCRSRQ